jgi:thiamine kinase-like enzyme
MFHYSCILISMNDGLAADERLIVFLDFVWAMMRDILYELAASISYDAWRG